MAPAEKVIVRDHWHVWRNDGKEITYCGGFYSDSAMKDALAWKNSQTHPEQYTVTNKGPLGIIKEYVEDPDAVMNDPVKKKHFERATQSYNLDGSRKQNPYSTDTSASAAPRAASKPAKRATRPVKAAEPVKPVIVDKALADAAQADLARVKADEKADLEAGINR